MMTNVVDAIAAAGQDTVVAAGADGDGRTLLLSLSGGAVLRVGAGVLWCECPSAHGRARRARGLVHDAPRDLRIAAVNPVGRYGLNIVFSDGHDRGVYPWTYLLLLARRPRLQDFLITAED